MRRFRLVERPLVVVVVPFGSLGVRTCSFWAGTWFHGSSGGGRSLDEPRKGAGSLLSKLTALGIC